MSDQLLITAARLIGCEAGAVLSHQVYPGEDSGQGEFVAIVDWGIAGAKKVRIPLSDLQSAQTTPAPAEPKADEQPEAPETAVPDISRLTVAELREIARDAGVEGYGSMRKADLIAALEGV